MVKYSRHQKAFRENDYLHTYIHYRGEVGCGRKLRVARKQGLLKYDGRYTLCVSAAPDRGGYKMALANRDFTSPSMEKRFTSPLVNAEPPNPLTTGRITTCFRGPSINPGQIDLN